MFYKIITSLIFCILFVSGVVAQTYNPSSHIVVNDGIGYGQATPGDSRSMFFDNSNFVYRDYNGTAEVLSYLNLTKYRFGHPPIYVHSGGILQPSGVWSGGVTQIWWFKNGTADSNLVRWYTDSSTTSCSGCLLAANNLNDVLNKPTARTNLGLGSMATQNTTAGGDLSGFWPNPTVSYFNGQLPSYYLNYANLTGKPNPLTLTTTGTSGVATYNSGTGVLNIPNYTGGGGSSCLNCNADTIGHIPVDFSTIRDGYVIALDSTNGKFILVPQTGGTGSGITTLNTLTTAVQSFATGTTGTNFNIVSSGSTHTFNLPIASGTNTGKLSNTDWTTFNSKEPAITASNTVKQYWNGYKQFVTLNTDSINEGSTNLFFTNTRARNAISLTTTGTSGAATYTAGTGVFNIPQYQGALTLTTTGTSGAATLIGNTLNIPQYSGGGGGTIGGSIAANQVAYGSSSNTIAGEAGFEYDAPTNTFTSDSAVVKHIRADGSVQYTLEVKPSYGGYAGILIDNQSASGAAANQIYLASGAGAYKDSGMKIYQLPQGFSGGYNFGVIRELGSGGLIIASDVAPLYFETGTPGVDNQYLGAAFSASKNWILGPDIGGGDLTDVHGVRLMVNGAFKTRDSVVFCDNGGGFANIYAGHYRDQGYLQDVGFQFYNRNSTSPFIAFRINPNASLFSNYYRTSATASGYTRLAVAFDGSGNMQQKQIFDSTSGTANPDQILYYEGAPTSNGNFKYSPTNKTFSINYGSGGTIFADSLRLYKGYLMLNDEGHNYTFIKALNYLNNPSYVEGVGIKFQTIKQGNSAVDAFRIDSAGEIKIPVAPASGGSTDSFILRTASNGALKQISPASAASILGITSLKAVNGLTHSADSIYGFEGTLLKNSSIDGGAFSLTLGSGGSKLSTFNINTTQGSIIQTGGMGIGSAPLTGRLFNISSSSSGAASSGFPGISLNMDFNTNNDPTTTGTSSFGMYGASFNQPTLTASNSVTYPEAATVYINGAPIASTNVTITNPYAFKIGAGNSYFNGNINSSSNTSITFSHFISNSGTPGIAAGAGAGSSPTVSIVGNDVAGDITVTTGVTPTTSATIATISYILAFPSHSYPILTPANSNAALLSGVTAVYTSGNTTGFTITSGTTALTGATTYIWHYQAFGD